jgi:hypothetical protein
MAIGVRCDTCGAEAPSLGSLQMHELRYHPGSSSSAAPSGPTGVAAPPQPPHRSARSERNPPLPRNRRRGIVVPLALAIMALLSGGAFAVTRSRTDAPPTRAELQAAAQRAVFTTADFPAGWTANPTDPAAGEADTDGRALAGCMGTTYEFSPTEAESSFSSLGLTAGSDFSITSSVERARADFAALAGPAAPGCFEQMFRKELDAEKPADGSYELKVEPSGLAATLPRDADRDAIGFRVIAGFHRGRTTLPVVIEVIMLRYDRLEATLNFTSVGEPTLPADLTRTLTDAVVRRIPNPA